MEKVKPPSEAKELPLAFVRQVATLATSGFGLVAALAWNNVIREVVDQVIKPLVGNASGLWSLIIYAVLVTLLALVVTLYIAKLETRLEKK